MLRSWMSSIARRFPRSSRGCWHLRAARAPMLLSLRWVSLALARYVVLVASWKPTLIAPDAHDSRFQEPAWLDPTRHGRGIPVDWRKHARFHGPLRRSRLPPGLRCLGIRPNARLPILRHVWRFGAVQSSVESWLTSRHPNDCTTPTASFSCQPPEPSSVETRGNHARRISPRVCNKHEQYSTCERVR